MSHVTLLTIVLILTSAPVWAGQWEDANAAHQRGDFATAVRLIRPLAIKGEAAAQYMLGGMYTLGQGVPEDNVQALFWVSKAADQGNADAQAEKGTFYLFGSGVAKNYREAIYWFRKAADQGGAFGQSMLGYMYANGLGVPKDDRQAYFWYLLASVENPGSSKARDAVESRLTPAQRDRAQADASAWKPR